MDHDKSLLPGQRHGYREDVDREPMSLNTLTAPTNSPITFYIDTPVPIDFQMPYKCCSGGDSKDRRKVLGR